MEILFSLIEKMGVSATVVLGAFYMLYKYNEKSSKQNDYLLSIIVSKNNDQYSLVKDGIDSISKLHNKIDKASDLSEHAHKYQKEEHDRLEAKLELIKEKNING